VPTYTITIFRTVVVSVNEWAGNKVVVNTHIHVIIIVEMFNQYDKYTNARSTVG